MAEETAPEVVDPNTAAATVTAVDMDVENAEPGGGDGGESKQKRDREEDESQEEKDDDVSKKQKVDDGEKSVEEQRLEKLDEKDDEKEAENGEKGEEGEEEKKASGPVNLGYKSFGSSTEMFNYFYNFLHAWPHYLNVNKYEHMMLLELLKNGHAEPDKKIGRGIRAFQVRNHPTFKSRCFFLIREDDSVDDFSFRKCVDRILPLPEDVHLKFGGGGGGKHHGGKGGKGRGGRGGGRGHGHGKGGRWRH